MPDTAKKMYPPFRLNRTKSGVLFEWEPTKSDYILLSVRGGPIEKHKWSKKTPPTSAELEDFVNDYLRQSRIRGNEMGKRIRASLGIPELLPTRGKVPIDLPKYNQMQSQTEQNLTKKIDDIRHPKRIPEWLDIQPDYDEPAVFGNIRMLTQLEGMRKVVQDRLPPADYKPNRKQYRQHFFAHPGEGLADWTAGQPGTAKALQGMQGYRAGILRTGIGLLDWENIGLAALIGLANVYVPEIAIPAELGLAAKPVKTAKVLFGIGLVPTGYGIAQRARHGDIGGAAGEATVAVADPIMHRLMGHSEGVKPSSEGEHISSSDSDEQAASSAEQSPAQASEPVTEQPALPPKQYAHNSRAVMTMLRRLHIRPTKSNERMVARLMSRWNALKPLMTEDNAGIDWVKKMLQKMDWKDNTQGTDILDSEAD